MTFQTQGEPRLMTIITGLLFEMISPSWGPMWSALAVGYAVIGLDGQVYLTDAGGEYLGGGGEGGSTHKEAKKFSAQTWLRAAQTMAAPRLSAQLKALAGTTSGEPR